MSNTDSYKLEIVPNADPKLPPKLLVQGTPSSDPQELTEIFFKAIMAGVAFHEQHVTASGVDPKHATVAKVDPKALDVAFEGCTDKEVYLVADAKSYPHLISDKGNLPKYHIDTLDPFKTKSYLYADNRFGFSIALDDMVRLGFVIGCGKKHAYSANNIILGGEKDYTKEIERRINERDFESSSLRVLDVSPPQQALHFLPAYPKLPARATNKLTQHFLERHLYSPLREVFGKVDDPITDAMHIARSAKPDMDDNEARDFQIDLLNFRRDYLSQLYLNANARSPVTYNAEDRLYFDNVPQSRMPEARLRFQCKKQQIPVEAQDAMLTTILDSFPAVIKSISSAAKTTGAVLFSTDIPLDLYKRKDVSAYYNPDGDTNLTGNSSWRNRNSVNPGSKGTYSRQPR